MARKLAPIVLFVYNRLWHTKQTVEALQQNYLAEESMLYIYSDGQKNDKDLVAVQEVRDYLQTIQGFRKVTIIEREKNLGLADSIVDGITETVNRYGNVIVLEDDLVTSPYFLQFMNDALERYERDEKVMAISGYQYPISPDGLPETFFLRLVESWGWATWKQAWDGLSLDADYIMKRFSKQQKYEFDLEGIYSHWNQLKYNLSTHEKTWAIFWYAHVFLKQGLSLFPKQSLVRNIGWDGSGQFCGIGNVYDVNLLSSPIDYFSNNIEEDRIVYERVKDFFKKQRWQMKKCKTTGFISNIKKKIF